MKQKGEEMKVGGGRSEWRGRRGRDDFQKFLFHSPEV